MPSDNQKMTTFPGSGEFVLSQLPVFKEQVHSILVKLDNELENYIEEQSARSWFFRANEKKKQVVEEILAELRGLPDSSRPEKRIGLLSRFAPPVQQDSSLAQATSISEQEWAEIMGRLATFGNFLQEQRAKLPRRGIFRRSASHQILTKYLLPPNSEGIMPFSVTGKLPNGFWTILLPGLNRLFPNFIDVKRQLQNTKQSEKNLRLQLDQKNQELKQAKEEVTTLGNQKYKLENDMKMELGRKDLAIGEYKKTIGEKEVLIEENKKKIETITEEMNTRSKMLQTKDKEIEDLKGKFGELEGKREKLEKLLKQTEEELASAQVALEMRHDPQKNIVLDEMKKKSDKLEKEKAALMEENEKLKKELKAEKAKSSALRELLDTIKSSLSAVLNSILRKSKKEDAVIREAAEETVREIQTALEPHVGSSQSTSLKELLSPAISLFQKSAGTDTDAKRKVDAELTKGHKH